MTGDAIKLAHARARAAWPGVELAEEAFRAGVSARHASAETGELAGVQTDDLYLALACLAGARAALDAFEGTLGPVIDATLSRLSLTEPERADVKQGLRVAFFVKKTLEGYSGRGTLRGFVRSAATRAALDLLRTRKRRPDDEDDILGRLPATGDPELDLLRGRFVTEFRDAFAAALADLDAADRTVLAQHYVDDLTIDQLAAVLGIHRATAARRVARVRALLLEGTRARLRAKLDVDGEAFESLMRLAGSRLHVSVFRLLRE